MTELTFTLQDGMYVSQVLQGGSSGILIPHLNFIGLSALIVIERTIDQDDGWATALSTTIQNAIYEDTIQGCTSDVFLRIKLSVEPNSAGYTT